MSAIRILPLLPVAAVFAFSLMFQPPLYADVVHLDNGGTLEGKVVEKDDVIVVIMPAGEVTVPRKRVKSVERSETVVHEYDRKLAAVNREDASAWLKLALWCKTKGLPNRAKSALQETIRIDPDNKIARGNLGYEKVKGVWYRGDDIYRAKGLVQYGDRWVSPEEKDRLERLDELEKRKRKMEDELLALEKRRSEQEGKLNEAKQKLTEAQTHLLEAETRLKEIEARYKWITSNPVYLKRTPPVIIIRKEETTDDGATTDGKEKNGDSVKP